MSTTTTGAQWPERANVLAYLGSRGRTHEAMTARVRAARTAATPRYRA